MLSSDGLHGVVRAGIIERVLNEEMCLEEMCRQLVSAAHDAGSPDNVTVVLIRKSSGKPCDRTPGYAASGS
jgi:serine/threonine protein phosphatase PrpC